MRLVVRDAAEADIAEAVRWYEQRSPGLGSEFLRAVDVAFAEIARMPERYPAVRGQVRRALLRRFPYAVFFIARPDFISIVACLHARRDPRHWRERSEADRQQADQAGSPARRRCHQKPSRSQLVRGALAAPTPRVSADAASPFTYNVARYTMAA